jgi:type II secretion system protein D
VPRLITIFALLLLCGGAFAQNPPAPAVPLPGAAPVLPGQPPPGSARLEFPNAEIGTVLEYYERLTGKRLVRDNQVVGQVYIVVNALVPVEEAIRIIEINLLMNGYHLVPTPDGKIVKVTGIGKNPKSVGVPIFSDADLLPENEQVVTFLFKLQFADPAELALTLQQAIPPNPTYGQSIVALPKAQSLLVTENSAIIRQLIRLVHEIDLPPAEVISEFITLERADAKDVLDKLKEIFEKTPSPTGLPGSPGLPGAPRAVLQRPQTTPDGTPLPTNATAEVTGPNTIEINTGNTLTEDSIIVGKIKLTADIRTNRIHVVTRPINLKFVRTLIKEFDSDVKFGEPTVRPLRFVSAGDVFQAVIKAIQDPGAKQDTATTPGAQQGTRQGQTGNRGGNQGGNIFGGGGRSGDFGGGGAGGGDFNISEGLSTEQRDTTPEAVTVGNTRIIADKRANAIIVLGNREVKEKIFSLLDELDVRAPQVMLSTVIGQLELTDHEQFGVDYILRKGGALGPLGAAAITNPGGTPGTPGTTTPNVINFSGNSPVLALNSLLNQKNITQIAVAGASGLNGFFTAGNTLDAIVTALESTNRFKVLSRPCVFTSNNEKAIIASGQEIAVPTQTLTSLNNVNAAQDNAAVSSSIQFKRVALQLEVVPLINSEREVSLDILQKVDEVVPGAERTIGGNQIPTIATRYIKTHVSVPNEATLVLGGLIRQSENKGKSGIPYLSRIPYLGALFRTTNKDHSRSELVILIRPVVTMTPDEGIKVRERTQEYLQMEPDLESTIYPPGIRAKLPPRETMRNSAVDLRENTIEAGLKK